MPFESVALAYPFPEDPEPFPTSAVFHAVVGQGAILTTINPAYTNHEVASQLRDANARLLLTTAALAERAGEAVTVAAMAIDRITIDDAIGLPSLAAIAIDADPPAVTIDPVVDIAVLPYSSGTTGLSKGVMLTHRNLVANLEGYGMTETSPAAYYAPPGLERDGTVGLLVADTEPPAACTQLIGGRSGSDSLWHQTR